MREQSFFLDSADEKIQLSCFIKAPDDKVKGVVQISHGMAEHKERYFDFMNYLVQKGYLCVIHDHRGHGESIDKKDNLGYFYDDSGEMIVKDLYIILKKIKKEYENVPYFIFAHSMGTLVARNFLKEFDHEIDGLILSGPPYENKMANLGIKITEKIEKFKGEHYRSTFINTLAFGSFDDKFEEKIKNKWLNSDINEVKKYNDNPLCGYIFTLNGFKNLFKMVNKAFKKEEYKVRNKNLPILFLAGEDDPVIGGEKRFLESINFLKNIGYKNTKHILYYGLRHEILNEVNKCEVYKDILKFIEENTKK
ncbi:alpha/beta hydrolase [Anaerofustis sp.]|uniref:alpha/beta fold hydrolase n=1 Tax=Anaerofustis sp. TaxID=1872517 RepID=UPI0025BAA0EE|nr:alpha/beta hydrolase [Anaerofustis sp.]